MKLTLGKKMGLGFGVILALMLLSALLTYMKSSVVQAMQERTTTLRVPSIVALKDLQRHLTDTASKSRQAVLAGGEPDQRESAAIYFYRYNYTVSVYSADRLKYWV